MTEKNTLKAYARFYETLLPETVGKVRDHVSEDVLFRDPFQETRGVDAYERILEKMFDDVEAPRFETLHTVRNGSAGYMKWAFRFRAKNGLERQVIGVTEIKFDESGRISEHLDYWDPASQLYESLPVIGFVLRKIRQKIAA